MSAATASTRGAPRSRSCEAAESSTSWLRAAIVREYPSRARWSAIPRPMPRVAPVTRALSCVTSYILSFGASSADDDDLSVAAGPVGVLERPDRVVQAVAAGDGHGGDTLGRQLHRLVADLAEDLRRGLGRSEERRGGKGGP